MTNDLASYERSAKIHVDAVRAAADASRDANENIPEKSDLHFGDPMDFWIKQVKLLLCIKLMYLSFITSDPLEIQFMFYIHSFSFSLDSKES